MTRKERKLYELKVMFNDIALREFGLDVDEDDHVCDPEEEIVYTIQEKFLKYSEDEYPTVGHDEIDMNLLENARLMEILFGLWIQKRAARKGIEITSYYPALVQGSQKGFFVLTYLINGNYKEKKSDVFLNESVQIFNLVTKIKHTAHLYAAKINDLDIEIERRKK